MGTRVHKVMGYGVQKVSKIMDVKKFNDKMEDDSLYKMSFYDFEKWIKSHRDLLESLFDGAEGYKLDSKSLGMMEFNFHRKDIEANKAMRNVWAITNFFKYDCEDMDRGFVIIPFSQKSWFRYDDIFDYYEESGADGPITRFTPLRKCGLYPYLGMQRFKEPDEKMTFPEVVFLRDEKAGKIEPSVYSQLVGWWAPKVKPLAKGKLLTHLLKDYRPVLPFSVGMIVSVLADCIEDPKAFLNALRPCIYVYWC